MPVDVAGAAVGAALGVLFSLAEVGAFNAAATCRQREDMESFLKFIHPIIQEIYDLYERLGPQQEMDLIMKLINEGIELFERKRIPFFKKLKHSNKLTKYRAKFRQSFPNLINLLAARNVGQMLRKMEEIREEISLIRSGQANGRALQSGLGDLGNPAVAAVPPLMVESEIEAFIRENVQLLEEKVPAIGEDAPGGRGETTLQKPCHDGEIKEDAGTKFNDRHGAEGIKDLQIPDRSTTQNPRNMPDDMYIQVDEERDDDQRPQNQQQQQLQQGWSNSAVKFHIEFALLKLLTIAYFRSFYTICEVIYLISLVEVTRPVSPNRVYWYSYLAFGTLGFELLLWTNLSLVMWLVINLSSLVVFAVASSHLLMRGFEKNLWFALPFDEMPVSEKFKIFMPLLAVKNGVEMLTNMEEIMAKLRSICSGQANGVALQKVPEIAVDASGGCGETLSPDGEIRAQALSSSSCHSPHMAINMPHLLMSDSSTTENPRNMVDLHQAVTTQGKNGRDDDQWPQNQQQQQQQLQQGWSDSAMKFHIVFGLLKLLTIAYFYSFYIICEVIYLISLVEVTRPVSSNQVYWYLYLIFGTLGFELLLWTNLSLVMWLVINLSSLIVFAAASSCLLMRGFEKSLLFALAFDDMPVLEKYKNFMSLLAAKNGGQTSTKMEEIMEKFRSICSGQANGVAHQRVPAIAGDAQGGCEETTLLKKLCPDGEISDMC